GRCNPEIPLLSLLEGSRGNVGREGGGLPLEDRGLHHFEAFPRWEVEEIPVQGELPAPGDLRLIGRHQPLRRRDVALERLYPLLPPFSCAVVRHLPKACLRFLDLFPTKGLQLEGGIR